jgi:hypothetical protein
VKQLISGISKKTGLIFVTAVLLLGSLGYWAQTGKNSVTTTLKTMMSFNHDQKLTVYFVKKSLPSGQAFSFDPMNSDWIDNEIILGNLIGTLVKFNISGKIEPYLADSWQNTPDRRKWIFKLKSHLICENGQEITAKKFAENLSILLKRYSSKGSVGEFEKLNGWTKFKNNNYPSIKGLYSNEDKIYFEFDYSVENLNEFLRLPYFGFWCDANLTNETHVSKIISSSAYKIINFTKNSLFLDRRSDWVLKVNNNYQKLEIQFKQQSEIDYTNNNSFYYFGINDNLKLNSNLVHEFMGTPTVLRSFILSPYKNGPFKSLKNRMTFQNRLRKIQSNNEKFKSLFFNLNAQSSISETNIDEFESINDDRKLTLGFTSRDFGDEEVLEYVNLIKEIFKPLKISVEPILKNPNENNWRQELLTNKAVDIRLGGVQVGGHLTNRLLNMVFCTQLGVTYPDPSGEICKLLNENKTVKENRIDNDFISKFNQLLYNEAVVLPLFHSGLRYAASKDIDIKTIPIASSYPSFEYISK